MNVKYQTIRVPTGVQDYRPALCGGIAAVELRVNGIHRVAAGRGPGRPDAADRARLHRRAEKLGHERLGNHQAAHRWRPSRLQCFERIRDTAAAMRTALERGDWDEVGRQIAIEWDNRRRLAPGLSTPAIDDLIARAMAAGATAAKVCGAGGGGCLFCYGPPAARDRIAAAFDTGRRPRPRLPRRDRRPAPWRTRVKLPMLSADDKLAEIKRLYYRTTAKTIQADLARHSTC